jgi:hypothetical protein
LSVDTVNVTVCELSEPGPGEIPVAQPGTEWAPESSSTVWLLPAVNVGATLAGGGAGAVGVGGGVVVVGGGGFGVGLVVVGGGDGLGAVVVGVVAVVGGRGAVVVGGGGDDLGAVTRGGLDAGLFVSTTFGSACVGPGCVRAGAACRRCRRSTEATGAACRAITVAA